MPPIPPVEKRIKRQVQGKPREFFISTPPGMENLCVDELQGLGDLPADLDISKGGVAFTGRLPLCYLANLHLRTANRILMRLARFTAASFRDLEKKIAEFPWELYLFKDSARAFSVTARHSRLIHTDAIAQRCRTGVENRLGTFGISGQKNPDMPTRHTHQIFVRAENDVFTLSLDSSGELLHRRGIKTQGGKAPMRETLAAGLLMKTGYQPGDVLVDPMCGTGTFSLEAAMISGNIPGGWYREFSFMDWPAFQPARWEHLRREAEKAIRKISGPMIFASDSDAAACVKLTEVTATHGLNNAIRVICTDFFSLRPEDVQSPEPAGRPGVMVLNPPYGRRLGSKGNADTLFAEIGKKLKKDFAGWRLALLVPDKGLLKHFRFSGIETHDFFHGGLKVTLLCGPIP